MLRCSIHSKYKGLSRPRESKRLVSDCAICWEIYYSNAPMREAELRKFKAYQKKYQRKYRKDNADVLSKKKKEYYERLKTDGIRHYGGKCSCCGEAIEEFLTLEHINGRSGIGKRKTGKKMWEKAKSEGYPDKYTVLCFNCNCAKGAFGYCPHELIGKENCK